MCRPELTPNVYPHILESIFEACSPEAQLALRTASRALRDFVDSKLFVVVAIGARRRPKGSDEDNEKASDEASGKDSDEDSDDDGDEDNDEASDDDNVEDRVKSDVEDSDEDSDDDKDKFRDEELTLYIPSSSGKFRRLPLPFSWDILSSLANLSSLAGDNYNSAERKTESETRRSARRQLAHTRCIDFWTRCDIGNRSFVENILRLWEPPEPSDDRVLPPLEGAESTGIRLMKIPAIRFIDECNPSFDRKHKIGKGGQIPYTSVNSFQFFRFDKKGHDAVRPIYYLYDVLFSPRTVVHLDVAVTIPFLRKTFERPPCRIEQLTVVLHPHDQPIEKYTDSNEDFLGLVWKLAEMVGYGAGWGAKVSIVGLERIVESVDCDGGINDCITVPPHTGDSEDEDSDVDDADDETSRIARKTFAPEDWWHGERGNAHTMEEAISRRLARPDFMMPYEHPELPMLIADCNGQNGSAYERLSGRWEIITTEDWLASLSPQQRAAESRPPFPPPLPDGIFGFGMPDDPRCRSHGYTTGAE